MQRMRNLPMSEVDATLRTRRVQLTRWEWLQDSIHYAYFWKPVTARSIVASFGVFIACVWIGWTERRKTQSISRMVTAVGALLLSLSAAAQVSKTTGGVVLPSPQLIHCRSVECSQLWNKNGEPAAYPAQVLTDVVNGEIVGLTAVYDKSVSIENLRSAIDTLYPKAAIHGLPGMWRVEAEHLTISLSDWNDGTKRVIYLKFARNASALVPSAHINEVPK